MKRWFMVIGMLALASTASAQDQAPKREKPKSGGANLITQAEIEYAQVSNAFDAIQRLRPRMLQKRMGPATDRGEAAEIVVYVDGARYGFLDQLSNIPAEKIKEIRYLNPADATTRYGTGHTEGVILVTSKNGSR